jgi:hypothetical protein
VSLDAGCIAIYGFIVWNKVKLAPSRYICYQDRCLPAYDKPTSRRLVIRRRDLRDAFRSVD